MARGSCLCGTVRWQADGKLHDITHCHCSMCRKAHAAPFASYTSVPRNRFTWLAGGLDVARYESSPDSVRSFCRICGSVTPFSFSEDIVGIPAGCMDDSARVKSAAHIFVGSKAPWHVLGDGLPCFDTWPDNETGPIIELPPPKEGSPSCINGSCLCGTVTFEVKPDWKKIHNCHCTRCRKARSAAHTTNGFTAAGNLRFLSGEQHIESYKLPSARFFRQAFCRTCGSGVPRKDSERDVAVIPFGVLDGDPGRSPESHIFVADKAPWYAIADDLPQFDQAPD